MAKPRPSDQAQLDEVVADNEISLGNETVVIPMSEQLRAYMQALGKIGGKKGGKERAKALSKARRKEIAKKAAKARWSKKKGA